MSDEENKIQVNDLSGNEDGKALVFTKSFTVDYLDPDTGDRRIGTFTVKRATLGDLAQYGIIKSRLNGGVMVDNAIDWINEMIAFCQVTLSKTPDWWNPQQMYDDRLLDVVYKHVRHFQDSFRNRRVGEQRPGVAPGSVP